MHRVPLCLDLFRRCQIALRDESRPDAHDYQSSAVSGDAIGISQRELVDRILAARSLRDIQLLADKLAIVGDDDAVETLTPMLEDPRRGVPEALLSAFVLRRFP